MEKVLKILKIVHLFIKLPFDISNGYKKRASLKIKKLMISAKLLQLQASYFNFCIKNHINLLIFNQGVFPMYSERGVYFFFCIFTVLEKIKKRIMKRVLQILKIIQLFIFLPFEISKGSKRRAYMRIKKLMISANLL